MTPVSSRKRTVAATPATPAAMSPTRHARAAIPRRLRRRVTNARMTTASRPAEDRPARDRRHRDAHAQHHEQRAPGASEPPRAREPAQRDDHYRHTKVPHRNGVQHRCRQAVEHGSREHAAQADIEDGHHRDRAEDLDPAPREVERGVRRELEGDDRRQEARTEAQQQQLPGRRVELARQRAHDRVPEHARYQQRPQHESDQHGRSKEHRRAAHPPAVEDAKGEARHQHAERNRRELRVEPEQRRQRRDQRETDDREHVHRRERHARGACSRHGGRGVWRHLASCSRRNRNATSTNPPRSPPSAPIRIIGRRFGCT